MWTDGVEALWVLFRHSNLIFHVIKYIAVWVLMSIIFSIGFNYVDMYSLSYDILLFGIVILWFLLQRQFVFRR